MLATYGEKTVLITHLKHKKKLLNMHWKLNNEQSNYDLIDEIYDRYKEFSEVSKIIYRYKLKEWRFYAKYCETQEAQDRLLGRNMFMKNKVEQSYEGASEN